MDYVASWRCRVFFALFSGTWRRPHSMGHNAPTPPYTSPHRIAFLTAFQVFRFAFAFLKISTHYAFSILFGPWSRKLKRLRIATVKLCGVCDLTSRRWLGLPWEPWHSSSLKWSVLVARLVTLRPHCHSGFSQWPDRRHLGHSAGHHHHRHRRSLAMQLEVISIANSCNLSCHGRPGWRSHPHRAMASHHLN